MSVDHGPRVSLPQGELKTIDGQHVYELSAGSKTSPLTLRWKGRTAQVTAFLFAAAKRGEGASIMGMANLLDTPPQQVERIVTQVGNELCIAGLKVRVSESPVHNGIAQVVSRRSQRT